MLKLFLIVAPEPSHLPALVEALRGSPPQQVAAPAGMRSAATTLARAYVREPVEVAALAEGPAATEFLVARAGDPDTTIAVVVGLDVALAIVTHALEAPVLASRLALDPGSITEVEVRSGAPWTVNRLNDRCHLGVELV